MLQDEMNLTLWNVDLPIENILKTPGKKLYLWLNPALFVFIIAKNAERN